jgi:hypothetical protein
MPDCNKLGLDLKSIAHLSCFPDEECLDPHEALAVDTFLPSSPLKRILLGGDESSGMGSGRNDL